jgi:hypothetical protein
MVSENSMFDVDESANESDSLNEDPTLLNELDEDEVNMTPLNSLIMTRFHFQDCCLIQQFGKFKGLTMVMQI